MLLRVRFDPPGWFANDPRVVVMLDGEPLVDGSFVRGFECAREVAPGRHTLTTAVHLTTTLARRREYTIDVPAPAADREHAPGLEARLRYSRLWGNFDKRLDLVRVDGVARPHRE